MQELALSTPGLAEWIRDELRRAEERAKQDTTPNHRAQTELNNLQFEYLALLDNMPTVDTVRVFADLLDNDYEHPSYARTNLSIAENSWRFLNGMLSPPPVPRYEPNRDLATVEGDRRAIEGLRQWREEVKRGDVTFRFKDSDQRYDFNGPVEVVIAQRDNKPGRGSGSGSGDPDDRSKSATRGQRLGIVVGLLALLSCFAVFLWSRARKGRSGNM